jgi:hypothetical protein
LADLVAVFSGVLPGVDALRLQLLGRGTEDLREVGPDPLAAGSSCTTVRRAGIAVRRGRVDARFSHASGCTIRRSRSAVPRRFHPVDVADTRLGQQPLTRAGQLPLGRGVVLSSRRISLGPAPATHRHASVGLGRMMVVELTTGLRCIFCGHGAPIGHGN